MICENCKKEIQERPKGICQLCGDKFIPRNNNQRFCGSMREKYGCAYRNRLDKQLGYNKQQKPRDPMRNTEYKIPVSLPEQRAEQQPEHHEFWFTKY